MRATVAETLQIWADYNQTRMAVKFSSPFMQSSLTQASPTYGTLRHIYSWMAANILTRNSSKPKCLLMGINLPKYATPQSTPPTCILCLQPRLHLRWTPHFFRPDFISLQIVLLVLRQLRCTVLIFIRQQPVLSPPPSFTPNSITVIPFIEPP